MPFALAARLHRPSLGSEPSSHSPCHTISPIRFTRGAAASQPARRPQSKGTLTHSRPTRPTRRKRAARLVDHCKQHTSHGVSLALCARAPRAGGAQHAAAVCREFGRRRRENDKRHAVEIECMCSHAPPPLSRKDRRRRMCEDCCSRARARGGRSEQQEATRARGVAAAPPRYGRPARTDPNRIAITNWIDEMLTRKLTQAAASGCQPIILL
jgi:hypothetical protein